MRRLLAGLFRSRRPNHADPHAGQRHTPLGVEELGERVVPSVTLAVSGQTNIFAAARTVPPDPGGGGGGVIPQPIRLASLGNPAKVDFPSVTGSVSGWAAAGGYNGPDGGHSWGGTTNVPGWGGISGIRDSNATMFLVGVFLGPNGQPATRPATPDVSGANNAASASPQLGQLFFIGDGRSASGALQTFKVPVGAAHLYLGFAEGWGFGGGRLPGFYNDNGGSLRVDIEASKPQDGLRLVSVQWGGLTTTGNTVGQTIQLSLAESSYSGPVTVRVYQSVDATLHLSDRTVFSQTITVTPNTPQVRSVLLSSTPLALALPVPFATPNYLIVVVDPDGKIPDANRANNVSALKFQETAPLSFELQLTAPLASTREGRVKLWVAEHQLDIAKYATAYHISAAAIAGAIAWEALNNVLPISARAFGPGKVHVTLDWGQVWQLTSRGEGDARLAEDRYHADPNPNRRLDQLTIGGRIAALSNPVQSIKYVAAIMGAYAEEAAAAGYDIHDRIEILTTYFNGTPYHIDTVRAHLIKDRPKLVPSNPMGLWVQSNSVYVRSLISG